MHKLYLKNLEKDYIFEIIFNSPYLMNKFLTKLRYSDRLKCVGKVKI